MVNFMAEEAREARLIGAASGSCRQMLLLRRGGRMDSVCGTEKERRSQRRGLKCVSAAGGRRWKTRK